MAVDASKVIVGALDQKTTGAVLDAPIGTPIPVDITSTINTAFKDSGYVSSDGVSLTTDYSTKDITEANGAAVRHLLESFNGEVKYTELEMSERALRRAFGDEAVTVTPAATAHGTQIKVAIGPVLPAARSWILKIKDGAVKIMIVLPRGQAIPPDEITFQSAEAIKLPITIKCEPDANNKSIYILMDDGVVSK